MASEARGIEGGRLARWLDRAARALALTGGAALAGLALMTCISIAGRALGRGPVPGDFELVEAGTAFAVFAFLPWCQLRRGHVTVDLLLARAGPRANAGADAVADLLMTLVALVLARQLWLGLLDKARFDETSFILEFPIWWAYAACLPGALLFVAAAGWSTVASLRRAMAG